MKLSNDLKNEKEDLNRQYQVLATEFTAITDKYRADMSKIGDRIREIAQMEKDTNAGAGAG